MLLCVAISIWNFEIVFLCRIGRAFLSIDACSGIGSSVIGQNATMRLPQIILRYELDCILLRDLFIYL
jgi:hypothetical protein